jgi:hypothetical protein
VRSSPPTMTRPRSRRTSPGPRTQPRDIADAVASHGACVVPRTCCSHRGLHPLRVVRCPPALSRGSCRRTGAGAVGVPGTVTRPPQSSAEPRTRPVRRARRRLVALALVLLAGWF